MKKPGGTLKGLAVFIFVVNIILLFFSVVIVMGKLDQFPLYRVLADSIVYIILGIVGVAIFCAIIYGFGSLLDILHEQKNYIGMIMLNQLEKDGKEIPSNLKNDLEKENEN